MREYAYDVEFGGIGIRILSPRPLNFPENLQPFLQHETQLQHPEWTVQIHFGTPVSAELTDGCVKCYPHGEDESFYRIVPQGEPSLCRLYVPSSMAERFCIKANWMLFLMPEHLLLSHGRCILHSSAVLYKGEAILFMGPSGIGKSTQASLWETWAGAEILNGDKVIVQTDITPPRAFGGPIAGTSGIYKNLHAPIRGIAYLHRGTENRLERMHSGRSLMALYSQAVKSPDDPRFNQRLLTHLERLAQRIPVYEYSCRPDASAVTYLQERIAYPRQIKKEEEK